MGTRGEHLFRERGSGKIIDAPSRPCDGSNSHRLMAREKTGRTSDRSPISLALVFFPVGCISLAFAKAKTKQTKSTSRVHITEIFCAPKFAERVMATQKLEIQVVYYGFSFLQRGQGVRHRPPRLGLCQILAWMWVCLEATGVPTSACLEI